MIIFRQLLVVSFCVVVSLLSYASSSAPQSPNAPSPISASDPSYSATDHPLFVAPAAPIKAPSNTPAQSALPRHPALNAHKSTTCLIANSRYWPWFLHIVTNTIASLPFIVYPTNHIYYLLMLSTSHLVTSSVINPSHKLTAYDGVDNDRFAWDLDIYDDTLFIGAYNDAVLADDSGSVYVFKQQGDEWNLTQKLSPNDGGYRDHFGRSVSVYDSYAFIAATYDNDMGADSGSVYIFNKVNEAWSQSVKLAPDDLSERAYFGKDIAVYDDYALIGAPSYDSDTPRGSAYFYQNINDSWTEIIKVSPNTPDDAGFGTSVSMSGNYGIVGAFKDIDDSGNETISAYVYKRVNGTWYQTAKLLPSNGTAGDFHSVHVSIYDSYAAIGGVYSNSVYIFKELDGVWSQIQTLSGENSGDLFGADLVLYGSYLLVGAESANNGTGAGYLFKNINGTWSKLDTFTAADAQSFDRFATSIAVYHNQVVFGAHKKTNYQGAAYISILNPNYAHCDFYSPTIKPQTRRTVTSNFEVSEVMEISFDLIVHNNWRCPEAHCHLLQIGSSLDSPSYPRLPLISMPSSLLLHVSYSDASDKNRNYSIYDTGATFYDGNPHSLYFRFSATERVFALDGEVLYESNGEYDSSQYYGDGYGIFVTNEIHSDGVPDVTMTDFCVYSDTESPTYAPTTSYPTNSPTAAPTLSPTTPTLSPTFCINYDHETNDGRNEMKFDTANINISNYEYFNNTDRFITSDEVDFVDQSITCDAMHCLVECNQFASCLLSDIIATYRNNETMSIFCIEAFSCLSARISAQATADSTAINVNCIAKNACSGMVLDIDDFDSLNVHCSEKGACDDMELNILINDNRDNVTNYTNDGVIHCVSPNSCDGLTITTASERTQLIMYEHSDDVILDNGIGFLSAENNIDCNTNRYVKFRGDTNETIESISSVILNEYEDDLPCSNVHVLCGNVSCHMTYFINQNKIQSLNAELYNSYDGCYWLKMEAIQQVFCEGECEQSPTKSPTWSPTTRPTKATLSPSPSPTNAPSSIPTNEPSSSPTSAPSAAPSSAPTERTEAPSLAPSVSPTSSPSIAPSAAPTRFPTADIDVIYDYYIPIKYEVQWLTKHNINFIVNNTEKAVNAMQEIIERSYHTKETLEYSQFFVYIESINGKSIMDEKSVTAVDLAVLYLNEPMILQTNIECGERITESILLKTDTPSFKNFAQSQLGFYFNNSDLLFTVMDVETLSAFPKFASKDPTNTDVIYTSIAIISFGLLCSFAAFAMNKIGKVDNSSFMVPLLISLAIYDFISDVNFTIQVWYRASFALKDIITWLGAASTFFTLFPLMTNLTYAMRISKQKTIKANPAARAWFKSHLGKFILICFATGGAYPGLSLVSSRIFGLDFFDCGLLTSELFELSKIKIKCTVLLENAPQLAIQVIYSIIIDKIESDTVLAFVASTLSVFASLIVYQAQKDQLSEGHIVKYFVRFYKDRGITQGEQQRIKYKKGLKEKMSFALSSVFEVPQKTMEIGYVTLAGTGCIIHIQHFVFNDDMEVLRAKLLKQVLGSGGFAGLEVQVTPELFITNFYQSYRRQISDALSIHFFDEKNSLFSVEYHSKFEEASTIAMDDGNKSHADYTVALVSGDDDDKDDDEAMDREAEGVLDVMATNLRQKTMNKSAGIQATELNTAKHVQHSLMSAPLLNGDGMKSDPQILKSMMEEIRKPILSDINHIMLAMKESNDIMQDIRQKINHLAGEKEDHKELHYDTELLDWISDGLDID